ncbi:unnamed protein product [marine sediment metagenome]|uniref:Next to BRCA1 central domain-containing protein n=1 Tax=marine sediment metagenome TaxID=412755 RepID=X1RVH2_9ZZZZ
MENYVQPPTSSPRPIGLLATIAKGTNTEIVEIVAPSSAVAGDLVTVEVRLKNTFWDWLWLAVTGELFYYNGSGFSFSPEYAAVDPGETYSFTYSFIMPSNDVWIDVWSWYSDGTKWIYDDYRLAFIALTTPGTISRMELEYDEDRATIPAYGILPG